MTEDEQPQSDKQKSKSGDTIIAQIGEDVQNVVVGKNVLQIGTLTIPYWVVALMLLVLLAILAFVAVPPIRAALTPAPPPEPMTGKFNIAVTRFGELDADGRAQPSDDGAQLSAWVAAKLTDEFEADKALFGSGNVIKLRLTDAAFDDDFINAGTLNGASAEERKRGAEILAAQIDADMVIYGNLTAREDEGANDADQQLLLEFYLNPAFGEEAQQIVGHYTMGDALPVSGSLEGLDSFATAKILETRAQALAGLTIGLIYDLLGDHEKALAILADLGNDLSEWAEDQGKELLYYLTARQQLFLGQDDEAEASVRKALAARPGYSRAHLVLGSVFAKRAIDGMMESGVPDRVNSGNALAEYEAAALAAEDEGNELAAQIARTALASAYVLEGQAANLAEDSEVALAALDRGLAELDAVYDPLDASGQLRYLAQAHLYAGNAYFLKAAVFGREHDLTGRAQNLTAARDAFNRCIELGPRAPADETLQVKVIDQYCQPRLDAVLDELAKLEAQS